MSPDWTALRAAAVAAMRRAYAPYSNFPVGAAGLVDDGRILAACNVENASYGLGLCAECGLVSMLHASGGGRLVAVACVDGHGEPIMPCGRCRQLLWEHGGPKLLVDHADGPLTMADLMPYAFDEIDLGRFGRPAAGVAGGDPAARVPAALSGRVGSGTAFLHPDVAGGQQVWTGYWSAGRSGDPQGSASVIEEGPIWPDAAAAVAWGRARTPRVVVVDGQGHTYWAGAGQRPEEFAEEWRP
jgi:cytidine deaminase